MTQLRNSLISDSSNIAIQLDGMIPTWLSFDLPNYSSFKGNKNLCGYYDSPNVHRIWIILSVNVPTK